jgi:hypothetical protein
MGFAFEYPEELDAVRSRCGQYLCVDAIRSFTYNRDSSILQAVEKLASREYFWQHIQRLSSVIIVCTRALTTNLVRTEHSTTASTGMI